MSDLISRQAAIDAINKIFPADPMRDDYTQGITCGAALANIYVGQLPSAQPDLPIKEKCAFCPHCNNCDVNDDLSIQPCVDTISRQDAINTLHDEIVRRRINEDSNDDGALDEFDTEAILRRLPPAQPQRKKGKWILVKGSNGKDYHKCSECLHTQEITGVKNYCAVCGADMGEQEDIPMEYFESGGR